MFYRKPKLKVSEQPNKTIYTIHNPHKKDISTRTWKECDGNTSFPVTFMAVDPGSKNLAIRIETAIPSLNYYKSQAQIRIDVTPTNGDDINCTIYKKISNFLDGYRSIFPSINYFIIERQLPENYRAVRISQHIISYLMNVICDLPLLPLIYEIDPKVKYKNLNAPSDLNNKTLKKIWGPQRALEIFTKDNDLESIKLINKEKKKDDLVDTKLLIEGFYTLLGIKK